MANGYTILDVVYGAVEAANTGFAIYKIRSKTGERDNHIVINTTGVETKAYVNKAVAVNVNVYVRKHEGVDSPNIPLMRTTVENISQSLRHIDVPSGMYWQSRIVWVADINSNKDGFDCVNIRLETVMELDEFIN